MTRDEFERFHWAYYLILEKKFIATLSFVYLNPDNFKTYSVEYVHLLLSTCSAFENSLLTFENYPVEKWEKIKFFLHQNFSTYLPVVSLKDYPLIEIKPFPELDQNGRLEIPWWEAYNKAKHEWAEHFKFGNMENSLYSLAALFVLNRMYIKLYSTDELDIPLKESELFELKNVKFKACTLNNVFMVNH